MNERSEVMATVRAHASRVPMRRLAKPAGGGVAPGEHR